MRMLGPYAGLMLIALAASTSALAQAGSAGGVIGKQGKSISGGEEPAAPGRGSPTRKSAPALQETQRLRDATLSSCGKIAGVWSWFIGGDVTINPNGTLAQPPRTGSWSCQGGQFVLTWSHGFVDTLVLSADGTRLSGGNQIGVSVSAVRRGN